MDGTDFFTGKGGCRSFLPLVVIRRNLNIVVGLA